MNCVDGFLLPVPEKNVGSYRRMARQAGGTWREHDALSLVECVADDVQPGELTSFPPAVVLKPEETVVFAWITYESREPRDRVNELVMKDPRLANMDPKSMPIEAKRMFRGGFDVLVRL